MGYWEQTGEENRRHDEARARMDPRWRGIRDRAGTVTVIVLSAALWAVVLVQTARWLF